MTFPLRVAIASSVRTAVGRAIKGTLKDTRPDQLAATVMQGALNRVDGLNAADVEDVILGCAMPEAEQGLNIAKNAAFIADWPDTVAAQTVNRFCASGLQAIASAATYIHAGLADVIVAGGVESMSSVPMGGNKVSLNPDLMATFPEAYIGMGLTAERVAAKFEVSRTAQDDFALNSHTKAVAAITAGKFKDEIITVKARSYKNGETIFTDFDTDECPRADSTLEALAKLRPVFQMKGSVTAGNASPINDGAAASVLLSESKVQALGITPMGYLCGFAAVGVAPDLMGIGPVPAIQKLLKQTGLSINDIDLFEINEAFAAQSIYCQKTLGIPDSKLNVNGGGIALGHPLGCTGAKLTATILHELKRRNGKFGVVSMCIGGGMGAAALFAIN